MDHPQRKSPRRLSEQDNAIANGPAIDSDRRNLLAIAAMAGIAVPFWSMGWRSSRYCALDSAH